VEVDERVGHVTFGGRSFESGRLDESVPERDRAEPGRVERRTAGCRRAQPDVFGGHASAGISNRYPTPRTVVMMAGEDGSASTWVRRRLMWTSRVLVSPT